MLCASALVRFLEHTGAETQDEVLGLSFEAGLR